MDSALNFIMKVDATDRSAPKELRNDRSPEANASSNQSTRSDEYSRTENDEFSNYVEKEEHARPEKRESASEAQSRDDKSAHSGEENSQDKKSEPQGGDETRKSGREASFEAHVEVGRLSNALNGDEAGGEGAEPNLRPELSPAAALSMATATKETEGQTTQNTTGDKVAPLLADADAIRDGRRDGRFADPGAHKSLLANQAAASKTETIESRVVSTNGVQSASAGTGIPLEADLNALPTAIGDKKIDLSELRLSAVANEEGLGAKGAQITEAKKPITQSSGVALAAQLAGDANGEAALWKEISNDVTMLKQAGQPMSPTHSSAMNAAQSLTGAAALSPSAQLVAAIRADKGPGAIEVRLDPPEMGRVRIEFAVDSADAVKAVLTAERPETLDHLRRNMSDLVEELKTAGFSSIEFEFSGEESTDFGDEQQSVHDSPEIMDMREGSRDVVYLSMRDDAQLNLLV